MHQFALQESSAAVILWGHIGQDVRPKASFGFTWICVFTASCEINVSLSSPRKNKTHTMFVAD